MCIRDSFLSAAQGEFAAVGDLDPAAVTKALQTVFADWRQPAGGALAYQRMPQPLVAVGPWAGRILESPRGEGGFGYDPLMWIPELQATVAELDAEAKNRHSHRARAMVQLRALLQEVWQV